MFVINNIKGFNQMKRNKVIPLCSPSHHIEGQCRICLEGQIAATNKLISPCNCKGSAKYVHENCGRQWILSTLGKNKDILLCGDFSVEIGYIQCEICKYKIEYESSSSLKCRSLKQIYQWACDYNLIFVLIVFGLIGAITSFCYCLTQYLNANAVSLKKLYLSLTIVLGILIILFVCLLVRKIFLKKENRINSIKQKQQMQRSNLRNDTNFGLNETDRQTYFFPSPSPKKSNFTQSTDYNSKISFNATDICFSRTLRERQIHEQE